MPRLITLTGPPGIGKGYVRDRIREHFGADALPVYMTRPLRPSDDGSRIYVDDAGFDEMKRDGDFGIDMDLFGYRYGFHNHDLAWAGKVANTVGEVHISIAPWFRERFPAASMLAVVTYSMDMLERRIRGRGDSEEQLRRRLAAAQTEIEEIYRHSHIFDKVLTTDEDNEGRIVGIACDILEGLPCP